MNARLALPMILAALPLATQPVFAQQDEAVRGCRAHAALSTSAYYDDIFVTVGRVVDRNTRNFALAWEAWVSDEKALTGACESDVRGAVVKFERLGEKTGRKPGQPAIPAAPAGTIGAPGNGGFGAQSEQERMRQQNQQQQSQQQQQQGLGALSAESAIQGAFNGLGMNAKIERARVVLQNGRGTVLLTGGFGGFNRITLAGQVSRQISNREYEITIDAADRARQATGTILVRLNTGLNEVEALVVNGSSNNQPFGGNFNH
jgi:hypothetical protein